MAIPLQKVIATLRATNGNIAESARRMRVTRVALAVRVSRSPQLKAIVADSRDIMVDYAETSLFRAVKKGQAWAVCFALKCQGKTRGYIEQPQPHTAENLPVNQIAEFIKSLQADGVTRGTRIPLEGGDVHAS